MNPGRLVKGSTPGTFARLSVHPVLRHIRAGASRKVTTLETAQGQIDSLYSHLPFKFYLPGVAFVGD